MIKTSFKNNKTIIPDSILKKIGAKEGDIIKFNINKEGNIELEIEKIVEDELTIDEVAEDLEMTVEDLVKELNEISADMDAGNYVEIDTKDLAKELGIDYP